MLPGCVSVRNGNAAGGEDGVHFSARRARIAPPHDCCYVFASLFRTPIPEKHRTRDVIALGMPDAFTAMVKTEIAKWGKVIKTSNIKAE